MIALSNLINILSEGGASAKRIGEMLDEKNDIIDHPEAIDMPINGAISFRHLTFSYPDGKSNTLDDVSFDIAPGELVGFIGRTGSGKSTVVELLLRTYNLNKGELFIDNHDIMDIKLATMRNAIGYVPQNNFLYSETIANNIAFGQNNADLKEIEKAAILADVHDNIMAFVSPNNQDMQTIPAVSTDQGKYIKQRKKAKHHGKVEWHTNEEKPHDGYYTIIGERGATLSGGQKQRISIARALIKDPAILILDDSLSAVDTETESNIIANLKKVRTGKTTLFVGHRISLMAHMDKIVLLEQGKVVAIGSHQQLLESSPLYQKMVKEQELEQANG
jgi:ATP-binding cassette subfamily B protein